MEETNNFTVMQLNKVTERLYFLLRTVDTFANVGGHSEFSKLKMFYDDEFNYYISYDSKYFGAEGISYDTFYIKFDLMGNEFLLNNSMPKYRIEELYKTLKHLPKNLPPNILSY